MNTTGIYIAEIIPLAVNNTERENTWIQLPL